MTEIRHNLGNSRKQKISAGGQPLHGWNEGIELKLTSSAGFATSAENTSCGTGEVHRHSVANESRSVTKQAFVKTARRKDASSFPGSHVFQAKNEPFRVSVSGEWALKDCQEYTAWVNRILKRGKFRTIADIRKSVGDGQTLVHLLELLAAEKIPGVYARPITRAQKLENLQLCMSFMGNRNIDLKGIYVGDLIERNLKSVLNLCSGLKRRFEFAPSNTQNGPHPGSSASMNEARGDSKPNHVAKHGFVSHYKDRSSDKKPQGNSSGYHSDETSPTRAPSSPSHVLTVPPGMLNAPDGSDAVKKTAGPPEVLVSTTELNRKDVLQIGADQRRLNIQHLQPECRPRSPSVEERLRSLLGNLNLSGFDDEDSEEELVIPPPQPTVEPDNEESFNVEQRLKSLLDSAEDDLPPKEFGFENANLNYDSLRELDKIGYVPSHPSDKMRNIGSQGRTDSFEGTRKKRGGQIPRTPPALRRLRNDNYRNSSHDANPTVYSPLASDSRDINPVTLKTVMTSQVSVSKPDKLYINNSERFSGVNSSSLDFVYEQNTPPHLQASKSEFLQQVADKLAGNLHSTTATSGTSSVSISPPDTPMLPALSPSSSVTTFMIGSSSDSSGASTPSGKYNQQLSSPRRCSKSNESGTVRSKRNRSRSGSKSSSPIGRRRSADVAGIQRQLEALERMYQDLLGFLNLDEKESKRTKDREFKTRGLPALKKQRTKDVKAVNKRFVRLESHVVTLARSVAHLSSELRSQAAMSQDIEEMKREIQNLKSWHEEFSSRRTNQSANFTASYNRVKKLRKFFGEEPPLLALFLKKLGYERFTARFEAEQVGILELPYMTEERLQGLGIPLGPRIRIMEESRKLL